MNTWTEKLPPRFFESFRCFDRRENCLPARYHQHAEIELTYVPSGSGDRLVGDHIGRFTDHDLVLLGEHLPHTWASDEYRGQQVDMHEAIVVYFNYDFLGSQFFELPEATNVKELFLRAQQGLWFPPEFAETVGAKMRKLIAEKGIRRVIELLECLELLCKYPNPTALSSEGFKLGAKTRTHPKLDVVLEHISNHFTDPHLAVRQLAELAGMNTSAFSRRFKLETGHTPTQYLNKLRLGFSRRLLLDQSSKIRNVCFESGFSSVSHFNKRFKSHFGITPGEFRESHLLIRNDSKSA